MSARHTLIVLPLVLAVTLASAAPARATQRVVVRGDSAPTQLVAGSQYYTFNLKGMRRYLDSIASDQPELWRRLDGELAALETRERKAAWLGWGSLGLGLALFAAALVTANDHLEVLSAPGLFALGGAASVIGGPLVAYSISPDREDLTELVNLHNRLAPQATLRLSDRAGLPPFRGLRLTVARF
jgi:hypothetical protein